MGLNPFAGKYPVTQSWSEHLANAGPSLGGVDYAMRSGTPLPVLDGTLEWVTRWTLRKPAWYNTGLGNAAAYRRADGTRTVYAHCSKLRGDGVPLSGNTGKSTNPHLHTHDVLADGRTRARPFSTIKSAGGAGGATPRKKEPMLIYQIIDSYGTNWLVVFNGKARILDGGKDDHEFTQIKSLNGNPVALKTRADFDKMVRFYQGTRAA